MHLIRGIDGFIEDLEGKVTYELSASVDPEISAQLTARKWQSDEEEAVDIAWGKEANVIWRHLESLLKCDATATDIMATPQSASVEDAPRKFLVGDTALVDEDMRSNYDCTVTIAGYTPDGYPLDQDGNSYREDELRLIRVGNPGLRPFESDLS
jgi:hypothetical protein